VDAARLAQGRQPRDAQRIAQAGGYVLSGAVSLPAPE